MADDYVCTLDEKTLKIAMDELHEDPKERMSSVETLRNWIKEHPHIKCDADTRYLLWFLRGAKFSQLLAREKLERFLRSLDEFSTWLRDMDLADEKFVQFYKTGYALPLGRDKKGRFCILYRISCLDTEKFTKSEVYKAIFGLMFHLMKDEANQVNGFTMMVDCTGFEMRHLLFFGIEDMKRMQRFWQTCLPGRFKGFQYYNTGAVFDTMMAALMPLLQQKFKDRITLHGSNLESVYKVFPMEMLPDEYLPDDYEGKSAGSVKNIIDKMIADVSKPENRERIKYETGPNFGIDESKKFDDEQQASFRKLNVE